MNTIKTIRERLSVTQQALADGMGCTQGNVGHYERGQTVPPEAASRLIAFAATRGLEIGFDHVYGRIEIPSVQAEPAPAGIAAEGQGV
jgi:putative transcriptional regulator